MIRYYKYTIFSFLNMSNYTISNIKMNNSFSLQKIQKTSNLDANSVSKQYKLNLMADFMRMKYENPKLKQSQIANQLDYSTSTVQRYRNDVNIVSPYRIQPNNFNKRANKASNTNFDIKSYPDSDVKRPRLTSNDLETIQTNTKSNQKNRHVLKAGSIHESIEINDEYLE